MFTWVNNVPVAWRLAQDSAVFDVKLTFEAASHEKEQSEIRVTVAGAHKGDWALPLIDQQFPNQLPEGGEVEVEKQQHRKRTTALDVFKSARL